MWRRFWRCLPILLVAVLAWSPAQPVVAQGQPPPPPTGQAQLPTLAPAQPAAGQAVLYDQMDSQSLNWISSQNSTDNQYDTQAADDFFVNPGSNSWQITAVEVQGFFYSGSGPANTVNVEFYADSGGLPGYRLYSANANPISGTAATGAFFLPLSPTVRIASNATYWVSVQAIQSAAGYWAWSERTTQTQAASVWQNPSNVFSTGCVNWTAINHCFPGTGPDLLFRLYGTQSSSQVTPVLLSLDPNAAIHRTFTLNAHGVGFANGAVLDFGPTYHFSTAVSGSTNLTALVPAAAVSGIYNSTLTVTVTNPGPCGGSCTSNALIFTLANRTYLPLVRR
jgi:hypothetical protein